MRQFILAAAIGAATTLIGASSAHAALAYGITTQNNLFSFDTQNPNAVISAKFVTGLQSNELIMGIDFRPTAVAPADGTKTGTLYAIGSSSRLYTIDLASGAASQIGLPFSDASNGVNAVTLNGTEFGFDFNPDIDRLRVTSDTDQNLVLNPNTGAVQLNATPLNGGGNPSIVGSAYDKNFSRTGAQITATPTQLYGIDSVTNSLVKQANNAGTITFVGVLGVDVTNLVGFDIAGANDIAYLSANLGPADTSKLYTVALGGPTAGQATLVGNGEIGGGLFVRDISITVPEPTTLGVLGGAAVMLLRRRGR